MILVATLSVTDAWAQTIASFKDRLTHSTSVAEGRISVDEHDSAMRAVDTYSATVKHRTEVEGYRVSIYSGKSQNARAEALAAQNEFLAMYPHVSTHLSYSEPYFTLSVGNCRTKEEALVLWGRVKNIFPKAFIMNATIPVEEFMTDETDYTAVNQGGEDGSATDGTVDAVSGATPVSGNAGQPQSTRLFPRQR